MIDTPETRASLLVRVRDHRDVQAWTEFVAIYEPLVLRLMRRSGVQEADARELTQEALVAMARAIDRWDPDPARGSFRGWLFRIARNLMINFLTRRKSHVRGRGGSDMLRLLEEQPAVGDESALYDFEYRKQRFHWAAERVRPEFTPSTWQAFWRTCVNAEPIASVARDLSLTAGAVYVARSRVMARLREMVQEEEANH